MKTIDVKYIDTRKFKARIHHYDWLQSWSDFTDLSEVIQFRDNDFTNYRDIDEYLTENGKLTPGLQAKLRAGTAFTIDYCRYSSADGGHYHLDGSIPTGDVDSRDMNGIIFLNEVQGMTYEQRRKLAEATLKTYTDWANGNVYWVELKTDSGLGIDSCGGLIGDDAVLDYIHTELADVEAGNVEIVGVYDE